MDIYKNKASGKFFIHVEDIDRSRAFFITPQGVFKTLNPNLFDYQESMDEANCLRHGLGKTERTTTGEPRHTPAG